MERILTLSGGIGGARFLRGLRAVAPESLIQVIANTGDDITLYGLKICPDLDTLMYTLGGVINDQTGWGREGETFQTKTELAAFGAGPTWFGLGDRDLATHLIRTEMLNAGYSLTDITAALCKRWELGVEIFPMCDERVETHIQITDGEGTRFIHFQEWWIRYGAQIPAEKIVALNVASSRPAKGVLEAIADADLIIFPPSNPVVSIGIILQVPGILSALKNTKAPIVGISPIISNAPVRGMADKCLESIGVETSAGAVAALYGARSEGGLLDGWLVDSSDASTEVPGIEMRAMNLFMNDADSTQSIARQALDLARSKSRQRT
ncbi:MAG TPA: 2-phospho-L-lactate transferase [Candidatus Nanopelagicaceae bacterium]|nr:2-phospho-L-lactate transferase [Candidatus Nanopelagicaceae bacterium]